MPEHSTRPVPPRPGGANDQVTMPLLARVTQQSLDVDYEQAARRRSSRSGETTPPRPPNRIVTAAVIAVFGLLVAIAAVQTSRNASVDDASRATLIRRIDNQRERAAQQQARIVSLRARALKIENGVDSLSAAEDSVQARLRRLQVRTGFVAVRGEGVRVVVEQVENADPDQMVADSDLALLADGLWASGAEAITINGHRLTALSGIRSSGPAIKVNTIGIAPPFTILAIGDTRTLEAKFYDTASGIQFDALARSFGFTYDFSTSNNLSLPSGPRKFLDLRSVQPIAAEDGGNRQ